MDARERERNDADLAFVNPRVLSWALKNGGVTRAVLAGKLKVSTEQLAAWEKADSHPPFPKAQLLAKTLRIPFGYLFLPEPPSLDLPLPDFRSFVDRANADKYGGKNVCEDCGQDVVPGQQNKKGITPPGNERHRDHIDPKSKGGRGTPENGQILCRDCNLEKSDN